MSIIQLFLYLSIYNDVFYLVCASGTTIASGLSDECSTTGANDAGEF